MMLVLVANIFRDRRHIRLADAEGAVPGLPTECGLLPDLMHP